jgi:hypothetical protein
VQDEGNGEGEDESESESSAEGDDAPMADATQPGSNNYINNKPDKGRVVAVRRTAS